MAFIPSFLLDDNSSSSAQPSQSSGHQDRSKPDPSLTEQDDQQNELAQAQQLIQVEVSLKHREGSSFKFSLKKL